MVQSGVIETIIRQGYSLRLRAFSAIDCYLRRTGLPFQWLESNADITALAHLFENLRFPGAAFADAALDDEGQTFYFHCIDTDDDVAPAYPLLSFSQDLKTKHFLDPAGVYPRLRKLRDNAHGGRGSDDDGLADELLFPNPRVDATRALMDAALTLARYNGMDATPRIKPIVSAAQKLSAGLLPPVEEQRVLLVSLLLSPRPDLGLELLNAAGFIASHWSELAVLNKVDHSKEFHPEGNGWQHTLETFRYRKTFDLRLSLALLLHDVGKAFAPAAGTHRFEGHSELGVRTVRTFLKRLGFDTSIIDDVCFLVQRHMMPAALKRLPLSHVKGVIESPLFPTLLELYRCDEASSFKRLDGYYTSSAVYQAYLKQRRNPYR